MVFRKHLCVCHSKTYTWTLDKPTASLSAAIRAVVWMASLLNLKRLNLFSSLATHGIIIILLINHTSSLSVIDVIRMYRIKMCFDWIKNEMQYFHGELAYLTHHIAYLIPVFTSRDLKNVHILALKVMQLTKVISVTRHMAWHYSGTLS